MAIKQGDKDYLEAHSKAKLEFLKKYLDRYLKILMLDKYTDEINTFDLFCGIGIYKKDNSKGSPVIIADLLKSNHEKFNRNTELNLYINDKDKSKIDFVSKYIERNYDEFKFYSSSLDAKEIIKKINDNVKFSSKKNFIFIDPHGYKDVYKQDISNLMNIGKTEILIFLPVYNMYRFLKPTKEDKLNPSYKSIRRIMDEFKLHYDVKNIEEYIDCITNAFTFEDKFYATSFKLKKDKSGNIYALFFITKHIKGLEKAVEVKWEIDEECGVGYKKKEPNLFEEEFSQNNSFDCMNNLENKLIKFLSDFRTNKEIYEFVLKNGFLPKHVNLILKKSQNSNLLEFDRKIRKNSFYISYKYYKNNEIKYKVKKND